MIAYFLTLLLWSLLFMLALSHLATYLILRHSLLPTFGSKVGALVCAICGLLSTEAFFSQADYELSLAYAFGANGFFLLLGETK
jgi:hypothetical protein